MKKQVIFDNVLTMLTDALDLIYQMWKNASPVVDF